MDLGGRAPRLDQENAAFDAAMSVDAVALRREFTLPWWFPVPSIRSLMTQFQRLNVLFTYRALEREAAARQSAA